MFVHIGNDFAVRDKDIVGIFDIENTSTVAITKDFLSSKNKEYISVTYDEPKTFVVTQEKNKEKIYICRISPVTIAGRL